METQSRAADEMVRILRENPQRLDMIKANTLPELQKLRADALEAAPAYTSDKILYRIAIGVLGALALIAAIGSIILVSESKTTPEVLVALGSAAVGALVGLFAPSPTGG